MSGNYLHGKSSAATDRLSSEARTTLMLIGLGVLVVLLHNAFRFPLNLPGRHGLDAMALIAMGRLISRDRWAAGIVGASAGGSALLMGAGGLAPLLYPICGLIVDLGTRLMPHWRRSIFVLPLIAGLAWASRPALRWLMAEAAGLNFDSLRLGLAWPVLSHLVFGMCGGFIALFAWRAWQRRNEQR